MPGGVGGAAAVTWLQRRLRAMGAAETASLSPPQWSPIALLRFASQGHLRQDESASRKTLRRAVPSFTVEIRRRPRLATTSSPNAQSSETTPPQSGFDRESHRVAAAAFVAKKPDPSPVDVVSSPKGRILPSLVPDEPRHRLLRDAPVSAADSDPPSRALKRPSVQPPKRRDQTSKSPRNSGFSSDRSAPLAERLSTASRQSSGAQPDNGAGASPRDPTPAPSQVVGNFGCLALRAKAKRRDKLAISCDDDRAKRLPNDQRSIIGTDPLVAPASRVDGRSPQGRKRTIMARYVFGDELKPGERWKRRLVTTR